jgi:hypothetical protein
MVNRYAVVNQIERDDFEKEWQMPYGYASCYITLDMEDAMNYMEQECPVNEIGWVVEEVSSEGRSVVYRR